MISWIIFLSVLMLTFIVYLLIDVADSPLACESPDTRSSVTVSFRECVLGRDPHCFWDRDERVCKVLPNQEAYNNDP